MKPTLFALLSAPRRPDLSAVAAAFSEESGSVGTVIFISDGTWLTVGASDSVDQTLAAQLRVAVGQGVTGQVARNGLAIRVSKDAPRTVVHRRLIGIERGGAVARLCLPARGIDGQILGVVAMHRPTEEPTKTRMSLPSSPMPTTSGCSCRCSTPTSDSTKSATQSRFYSNGILR